MSDSPNLLADLKAVLEKAREMRGVVQMATAYSDLLDIADHLADALAAAEAERDRLTADCARKDAALEPFAAFADWMRASSDETPITLGTRRDEFAKRIPVAAFRAAASARGEGSAQ